MYNCVLENQLKVREKSVKSQGICLELTAGNPDMLWPFLVLPLKLSTVHLCPSVSESTFWHYVLTSLMGSTLVWEIDMSNQLYQLK